MTNSNGKRPFDLDVKFPTLDHPNEIQDVELERLLNYLRKISNDDYHFSWNTNGDFLKIRTSVYKK